MAKTQQPRTDARAAEAGTHAELDNEREEMGSGMPHVWAPGLAYSLPARADGNIYSRPLLVTSVKPDRQLVTGHLFLETGDTEPTAPQVQMLTRHHYFVTDIPMGNPAEPNKCHWLAKNYTGRSDSTGLTAVGSTEVTGNVSEGNQLSEGNQTRPATDADASPNPPAFDPADANKDGVVTNKERRKHEKQNPTA